MRRKLNLFAKPNRTGSHSRRRSIRVSTRSKSFFIFPKTCRPQTFELRLTTSRRVKFQSTAKRTVLLSPISSPKKLKRIPRSRISDLIWQPRVFCQITTRNFDWRGNRNDRETDCRLSANEPAGTDDDAGHLGNPLPADQYFFVANGFRKHQQFAPGAGCAEIDPRPAGCLYERARIVGE